MKILKEKKLVPFGWETVTIASANLLGIFMIIFANQYIEIRWGILAFIFFGVLFAGLMYFFKIKKVYKKND